MRSKKYWAILIAVLLISILTIGLVSCTPDPDDDVIEEVDWQEYLNVVGKAFDSTYDVNFSKAFNFDASLDLKYNSKTDKAENFDKTLKISTNVNFSDLGTKGTNLFALEYGDKGQEDADKRFNLYADNEYLYINIYGAKFKIDNAEIFTALKNVIGEVYDVTTDITGFQDILYAIGFMCFENGTVNEAKTVYSFDFTLKKIAELIMPLLDGELDDQLKADIFSIVGATTLEEFMANLPIISGKLNFDVTGGKFVSVGLSDVSFDYARAEMKGIFDANLKVNSLANGSIDTLAARMPLATDESYVLAKAGAVRGNGSLEFMTGNNSFVTYDWALESNLDIIRIIGGMEIPEDNYFHFRLSHNCTDNCGAYCASKYRKGGGAIIDIGFSPKDFGTEYIYASVSIQALLGPAGVETLAPGYGNILNLAVPAYSFFTIDTSAFAFANSPFTAPKATEQADAGIDLAGIMPILKAVFGVIKGTSIGADGSSATLNIADVLNGMDQGATLDTVNQLLSTPSNPIDKIKMSVDMIRFNDNQNNDKIDVYYETVYSKGNSSPGLKSYSAMVADTENVNIDWTPVVDDNNKAKIFTSSDLKNTTLIDSTLTPAEANGIIKNSYVEYSGINVMTKGTSKKNYRAKVVGINGIDYTKLDIPQNVKIMTAVPSNYVAGMVKDALVSFIDLDSILYTTVDATITLTAELDFSANILEKDDKFMLGEDFDSFMEYSYSKMVNGEKVTKSGRVEGSSSALIWNNGAVRAGKVGEQTITYSVVGHTITKAYTVEAPASYEFEYSNQESLEVVYEVKSSNDQKFKYGTVTFKNADESKSYKLNLDYANYTMPSNAVRTSALNVLAGTTKYGLYFNEVDALTIMQVDLFGYKTVERVLNVTPQATTYDVKISKDALNHVMNSTHEYKFFISRKTSGLGAGYTNLKMVWDVKISRVGAGSSQPAVEGVEYTIDVVDSSLFDVPNNMTGTIIKKMKFTPTRATTYQITGKAVDSVTNKQIFTANYSINVSSVLSTYKTELQVNEDDNTATGTYTVDKKNSLIEGIGLCVMSVQKLDTASGKYITVPQTELVMKVNGTEWYDFRGILSEEVPTTLNYTFEPTDVNMGQKYKISFYLLDAKTGGVITGTMSSGNETITSGGVVKPNPNRALFIQF